MTPTPRAHLDRLDRTTTVPWLRTRAQMMLLAAEQGLTVSPMAAIVRERAAPVVRWRNRDWAAGLEGVQDAPRPGRPSALTEAWRAALPVAVRRRPRSLGLPCARWTLQRLADDLAEPTGMRVSDATVRRALKRAAMVLRRPQPKSSSPDPGSARNTRRSKRPAIL
jgi:transposase